MLDSEMDDSDIRKLRPRHYTRRNAAGEEFHTYADPDAWPCIAAADEATWQYERAAEAHRIRKRERSGVQPRPKGGT